MLYLSLHFIAPKLVFMIEKLVSKLEQALWNFNYLGNFLSTPGYFTFRDHRGSNSQDCPWQWKRIGYPNPQIPEGFVLTLASHSDSVVLDLIIFFFNKYIKIDPLTYLLALISVVS